MQKVNIGQHLFYYNARVLRGINVIFVSIYIIISQYNISYWYIYIYIYIYIQYIHICIYNDYSRPFKVLNKHVVHTGLVNRGG